MSEEKVTPILLSRFLVGVRHKRIFRVRNLSGELIDKLIELYSDKFDQVSLTENSEDFSLKSKSKPITVRFNRDDILVEALKTYNFKKSAYVEINKEDLVDLSADCLEAARQVFKMKKDFSRIGMVFEFNLPKKFVGSKDLDFGAFIKEKFINFSHEGTAETGAVRFSYKLPISGGGVLKHFNDYHNVIIQLDKSKGINEVGEEEQGLLINIDIQRIFDPSQDKVDIKNHFEFCQEYINKTLMPEFKTKEVTILW